MGQTTSRHLVLSTDDCLRSVLAAIAACIGVSRPATGSDWAGHLVTRGCFLTVCLCWNPPGFACHCFVLR
jgi:hypothetical protein